MRLSLPLRLVVLGCVFCAFGLRAEVSLPKIFGPGMVLQRDVRLPVWGWAAPGEEIAVELAGQVERTTASVKGEWRVDLAPLAAGGPHTLAVKGRNTLEFGDVLVGEVWLCSGQSNMEWPVSRTDNAEAEIAAAELPQVRLFQVAKVSQGYAQRDVKAEWRVCSPATVPGFSAVGYLFGRRLHRELGVPVGLINSSWGGTRIEPWTPPAGFAGVPRLVAISERVHLTCPWSILYKERLAAYLAEVDAWQAAARQALADETGTPPRPVYPAELVAQTDRQQPTTLYNGMIHGLVPYALRGAIWYQGESNRADGLFYYHKMQALVQGWRTVWGQGDFPFFFVQLAPYTYGGNAYLLPHVWEAQARAADEIPNTGMAVINDVGNLKDIHPGNKQDVADRLARLALAKTYGKAGVVWSGPRFAEFSVADSVVTVRFTEVQEGLRTRDGQAPTWFEVVDAEKGILKAEAKIVGPDRIELTAAEATRPVGLRFAWHQLAEPNLANGAGLPASAFRAGQMPVRNELELRIPAARGYTTVYTLDIPDRCGYDDKPVEYAVDHSKELPGPFDRIAYCLELKPKGQPLQYVFVAMDPFTSNPAQIGVPTVAANAMWQQEVKRLTVESNVPGVPVGEDMGNGNIEFWPSNYGPKNEAGVRGASSETFDFGDSKGRIEKGYGSMQVHLPSRKTTLFAFNRWGGGGTCEAGIGNSPDGNPDWTFKNNIESYEFRRLTVLVRIDE